MSGQIRAVTLLAAQQKMRDYEAKLEKLGINEDRHYGAINEWKTKSDARVKGTIVKQRFEELKARREADLDVRRTRLASKLMKEDVALKQELVSMQETPEQRRAKLAARARELAGKRESERQELANTLLERAFTESCDVLRSVQSKRMLYRTLEERTAQIEQRMAIKIMEEEEKRMYHEMNEQERLKAEQRHMDDKRRQREAREATNKVLDEQIRLVNLRRDGEKSQRLQEIQEMRVLWQKMAQEQEEEEEAERERLRRLQVDVAEFNRLKRMELTEKERIEKELDLKILQEALAKEAADEGAEQVARAKRIDDVRRYREQLAIMMQNEAESDAERDAMFQAVFDEQQAKRDAEVAARDEARRRLMAEVDAIRQQQILHKQMKRQEEIEEVLRERELREAEEAKLGGAEAARRAEQRKKALLQRLEIQTQMVAKAHRRAAEETERLEALEVMQANETAFMAKVSDTLEGNQPESWHGRKKVDWYH